METTGRKMLKASLEATGVVVEAGKVVVDGMVHRSAELPDDEDDLKGETEE